MLLLIFFSVSKIDLSNSLKTRFPKNECSNIYLFLILVLCNFRITDSLILVWNVNLLFISISKSQRKDLFHKWIWSSFNSNIIVEYYYLFGKEMKMDDWGNLSLSWFHNYYLSQVPSTKFVQFHPCPNFLFFGLRSILSLCFWWSTFNPFSDFFSLTKEILQWRFVWIIGYSNSSANYQFYLTFLHQSNLSSIF